MQSKVFRLQICFTRSVTGQEPAGGEPGGRGPDEEPALPADGLQLCCLAAALGETMGDPADSNPTHEFQGNHSGNHQFVEEVRGLYGHILGTPCFTFGL